MDSIASVNPKKSVQATSTRPKRGLGRGLDALLPVTVLSERVRQIEVSRIDPSPHQSRQYFHPGRMAELAESIKLHGVVQPIVVRASGQRYVLIAGERRWRACALAGVAMVPAIVRDVPDNELPELTLIENIQREDLNPIEMAEALARLSREHGLSHEQLASRTGKDRATVTNVLRLLRLPVEVRNCVASGDISMGHARALLALPDEGSQKILAALVVTKGLSVRQTEAMTKSRRARKPKAPPDQDPNISAAIQEMERALGTRVRVVGKGSRGKIEIEYYSRQDRDRIYSVIVGQQ